MTLQLERPWAAADRPLVSPDSVFTDVLRRWAAGHDTAEIAAATGLPEADVCRIISADQDRRHALKLSEPRA